MFQNSADILRNLAPHIAVSDELRRVLERESIPDRPYEFTPDAVEKLGAWGLGEQFGRLLIALGEKYSYTHPLERSQQIFSGSILKSMTKDGQEALFMGSILDTDPAKPFGDCIELAARYIIEGRSSGVLRQATPFGELYSALVTAYSPTHFFEGAARHTWVGLLPADKLSPGMEEMIIVDPGFRVVTTMKDSAYSLATVGSRPEINYGELLPEVSGGNLSVGTIAFDNGRIASHWGDGAILGLSPDYRWEASLHVNRDINTQFIRPTVTICGEDGSLGFICSYDGVRIVWDRNDGYEYGELPDEFIVAVQKIIRGGNDALEREGINDPFAEGFVMIDSDGSSQ